MHFCINKDKVETESKRNGLPGVFINSETLDDIDIINQYCNIRQVENAFSVTKHDLKLRPIYHWKPSRVKAHIAISFIAYILVKHLENRVKLQYIKLSPEKIRQTLVNVQTSIIYDKKKNIRYALPSSLTIEAKRIYKIANISIKSTPYILEKCSVLQK